MTDGGYLPPAGDAPALIPFFGRDRGRGDRATAKPTGSRRSSADGQGFKSGDFLQSKKYYSALTVWIGGTG